MQRKMTIGEQLANPEGFPDDFQRDLERQAKREAKRQPPAARSTTRYFEASFDDSEDAHDFLREITFGSIDAEIDNWCPGDCNVRFWAHELFARALRSLASEYGGTLHDSSYDGRNCLVC